MNDKSMWEEGENVTSDRHTYYWLTIILIN